MGFARWQVGFSLPASEGAPPLNLIKGIFNEIMKRNFIKQFNKRVILSGKILEIYEYERPVIKGSQRKRYGRSNACKTTDETKQENRKKVKQNVIW